MYLDAWAIALFLVNALGLFLVLPGVRTAVRVLRHWNPASDSALQISLENETWLAATLVQYGMGFQIAALVLFVAAADSFSGMLAGAMCATGSLLANPYGFPLLWLKMAGVFLYGFWLLLHRIDISVETYPLVRVKFTYLLFLLPLVLADAALLVLYLGGLSPDIITSCCAVVFGGKGAGGSTLAVEPGDGLLVRFYGIAALMAGFALFLRARFSDPARRIWDRPLLVASGAGWAVFAWISFQAINGVFSSYVYAMPFHHCPFCMLKPQYGYIGYLIYLAMFTAVFAGTGAVFVNLAAGRGDLVREADRFTASAALVSFAALVLFVVSVSAPMAVYLLTGGE